jgi:hypothetical protein
LDLAAGRRRLFGPLARHQGRFSRTLARDGVPLARNRRGEYDLWQRRFWEHVIRDNSDFARHVDYIHHNPVKHGLVANPSEWRWSSIHYYVRRGIIAPHCRGHQPDGRLAIDASRIALRFIQGYGWYLPREET